MTKRRQWMFVLVVGFLALVAGVAFWLDTSQDFSCTADRQDAIETGQSPPDCE